MSSSGVVSAHPRAVVGGEDGDVGTVPEHLHLPTGSIAGAPVPAVPVGPLEDALRALPVRQLHVGRHLPVVAVLVQYHQPLTTRAPAQYDFFDFLFKKWRKST